MSIQFYGLKQGEIALFVVPAEQYASVNLEILKHYVNQKNAIVFMSQ